MWPVCSSGQWLSQASSRPERIHQLSRYKEAIFWLANHGGFDPSCSQERRYADLEHAQVVRMTSDLHCRPLAVVVQDVMRLQDLQKSKTTVANMPTDALLTRAQAVAAA